MQELKDCQLPIQVELKPRRAARSLKQNAMLWALIEKIAQEQSGYKRKVDVNDVYCEVLEQANCVYEWVLAPQNNNLAKAYRGVLDFGTRDIITKDGETQTLHIYKCYIGSSKFNTKEMTDLIECALDICAELGINDSEVETTRATYAKA